MNPKQVRNLLVTEINKVSKDSKTFCFNLDSSFTRNRKISIKML